MATPGAGDIWVGSADTWLIGFIPAVIQRVAQHHPNIAIHALEANASDFEFHKLRERRLDLMVGRIGMSYVHDDLNVEVLYEEPIHAVVGARNSLANRGEITLPDLVNEHWMMSEPGNIVASHVSEAFRSNGLE